jgi:hypothetical protein
MASCTTSNLFCAAATGLRRLAMPRYSDARATDRTFPKGGDTATSQARSTGRPHVRACGARCGFSRILSCFCGRT